MDHVISNFGNINYKTELEMKVSLLEKENFELRSKLIDKLLIIKQLKTESKSNQFPTDVSSTTNTITKPAQTNANINSNNNNNNKHNNNNNNINNNNCKTRTMTRATTKMKKTIIALMKRQFTTKSYKHNWMKFKRENIQTF